jgi:hypothetical protein
MAAVWLKLHSPRKIESGIMCLEVLSYLLGNEMSINLLAAVTNPEDGT